MAKSRKNDKPEEKPRVPLAQRPLSQLSLAQITKLFARVGRDLFLSGAVTSHGGNLSMSDGRRIWITRTGSQLGRLGKGDVIETTWNPSHLDMNCSSELVVHRAIHHAAKIRCLENGRPFGQQAIVHAHTVHTTLRSMFFDQIEPLDSECKYLMPQPIEVVRPAQSIGSPEAAQMISALIGQGQRIAVIGGHGPFAVGRTLPDAVQLVSSLEHSCKLANLIDMGAGKPSVLPGIVDDSVTMS